MLPLVPSLDTPEDSLARLSITDKLPREGEAGERVWEREGERREVGSFKSFHFWEQHTECLWRCWFTLGFLFLKTDDFFFSREKVLGAAAPESAVCVYLSACAFRGGRLWWPQSVPQKADSPSLGTAHGVSWNRETLSYDPFCPGPLVAHECRTRRVSCKAERRRLVGRSGGVSGWRGTQAGPRVVVKSMDLGPWQLCPLLTG